MAEDRKFKFENGQFVNRVSGEPIPHNEPVIIFRARDVHAIDVLAFYHGLIEDGGDPHHLQVVGERLDEFMTFRNTNPDRMKEPGVTRHVELHSSRRHDNLHEGRRHEAPLEERVESLEHRDATLERNMEKVMSDIDTLNEILQGIGNDATTLSADFKGLEAELLAAQEAAANNQPIDLTSSILLARNAQTALDAIVQAAAPAVPADGGGTPPGDGGGTPPVDGGGTPPVDGGGTPPTDGGGGSTPPDDGSGSGDVQP